MARSRVRIEYDYNPYGGGLYNVTHYYWGWFPVTIRRQCSSDEANRKFIAYERLLKMRETKMRN